MFNKEKEKVRNRERQPEREKEHIFIPGLNCCNEQ